MIGLAAPAVGRERTLGMMLITRIVGVGGIGWSSHFRRKPSREDAHRDGDVRDNERTFLGGKRDQIIRRARGRVNSGGRAPFHGPLKI